MDCATIADGQLDARLKLPGGENKGMKVSKVRTDTFLTRF
jgi:hypothetical protein